MKAHEIYRMLDNLNLTESTRKIIEQTDQNAIVDLFEDLDEIDEAERTHYVEQIIDCIEAM